MAAAYVGLTESATLPTITMLSNTARILAAWKPTGKPEFEDKDLLHIAILEAAVLPVEE